MLSFHHQKNAIRSTSVKFLWVEQQIKTSLEISTAQFQEPICNYFRRKLKNDVLVPNEIIKVVLSKNSHFHFSCSSSIILCKSIDLSPLNNLHLTSTLFIKGGNTIYLREVIVFNLSYLYRDRYKPLKFYAMTS